MNNTRFHIDLTPAQSETLDALIKFLESQLGGLRVTKAAAVRMAIGETYRILVPKHATPGKSGLIKPKKEKVS